MERFLDVGESDCFRYETVEVQTALQIQIDQHREVTTWQTVAVPRRLKRTATTEYVNKRQFDLCIRVRDTNEYHSASQVTSVKCLLVGRRETNSIDNDVGTIAIGQLTDALHYVFGGTVNRVGGAKVLGPTEFRIVNVDCDDLRCTSELAATHRGITDAAAANDGDRIASADATSIDGCTDTGHDATAQESSSRWTSCRVDFGTLPGSDKRLFSECPDAECRAQFCAIGQCHLLGGIVGIEAVLRFAPITCPAVATDGSPVQDDVVAGSDVGNVVADRFDNTCGFVPEQERKLVVDPALAVMQVGVADPTRLHLDQRLTWTWVGNDDRFQRDGRTLRPCNYTLYFMRHL